MSSDIAHIKRVKIVIESTDPDALHRMLRTKGCICRETGGWHDPHGAPVAVFRSRRGTWQGVLTNIDLVQQICEELQQQSQP
jgi:hypothetical protein